MTTDPQSGQDPAGAVTVWLGADGVAQRVRVATDWRRRLGEDQLAAAVIAADTDAAIRRLRAELPTEIVVPATAPPGPTGDRAPRDLGVVASDVFGSVDAALALATDGGAIDGRDNGDAVSIAILGGRIARCTFAPRWLARQDEVTVAAAIHQAIAAANAVHQDRAAQLRSATDHLDDLLAELLAGLAQPQPEPERIP